MAITFIEQRKKQKKLIWVLAAVVIITAVVVWYSFLRKPSSGPGSELTAPAYQRAEIDFKILDNPVLDELKTFEDIKPFEGQEGRENPFLPY